MQIRLKGFTRRERIQLVSGAILRVSVDQAMKGIEARDLAFQLREYQDKRAYQDSHITELRIFSVRGPD